MLLQRFQTYTTRSIASVGELAECYDLMHFALLLFGFGLSYSLIHSLFPCQLLEWLILATAAILIPISIIIDAFSSPL